MQPGDTVEDVELVDGTGTPRRLSGLPDDGPVVLFVYPLLSDEGHRVAEMLGAYRSFLPGGLHTRRMTFVFGQDRRFVDVVAHETRFDRRADEAPEIVREHRAVA